MLLSELIPWRAKRLAVQTPPKMWAFNPSIVRWQDRTLCSVRLANYHMPGAMPAPDNPPRGFSRCAILELDDRLEVIGQSTVFEHGLGGYSEPAIGEPAAVTGERERLKAGRISRGFEDYRLFTVDGELHASASSACTCDPKLSLIEICHLELQCLGNQEITQYPGPGYDPDRHGPLRVRSGALGFQITAATPLRGPEWSSTHQKNWMPYIDHPSNQERWLYSPERGGLHSIDKRLTQLRPVKPSQSAPSMAMAITKRARTPQGRMAIRQHGGVESRVFSGRRAGQGQSTHGRVDISLRGGTQLVPVPGSQTWIGLAHGYRGDGARKFYWHALIAVDANANLLGQSRPFKLCENGIEFAAGMVIDERSGQVAVSYGVDDDEAWVGVGALGDLISLLPEGSIQ